MSDTEIIYKKTNPQAFPILVVEDDEDILELMIEVFSKRGYIVVTAKDGFDAESILKSKQFAAIILDIALPGKDGMDLAKIIREHEINKETPIVVESGCLDTELISQLKAFDVSYVAMKPFDATKLVSVVAKSIDKSPRANGVMQAIEAAN